ncbi:WG repeat-containing protein [Solitalea canadensis]|nr:WG repeat-containing protein [Solitalea canadensis]
MNKNTTTHYILVLLSILLVSCQPKNNTNNKKTLEKLSGHLDTVGNCWVGAEPLYSVSRFEGRSEYTSVSKLDAKGESIGLGLINRKGEIVVPVIYDGLDLGFADGVCQVNKDDKLGLVNTDGIEIVAPTYDYIENGGAVDGLLRVGKNDRYGMISLKGEIVIPVEYQDVIGAYEGMIAVMVEPQRWGYLNHKNEMVVKPEFTFVDKFVNGKVVLQKADGENYIVYKDGRVVKETESH